MGKIQCPKCKAEVEENNKFCTECGEKIDAQITCPQCSTMVPPGTKFCTECGANLEKLAETKCPQCSKILPSNTKFCPECGTKIGEPPSKQKNDVDETIDNIKKTGEGLLKEAGGLFKKRR